MTNLPASVDAPSLSRTFQVGVIAATFMSILAQISIWMSIPFFSFELFLGALITGQKSGSFTWLIGFAWHLLNGGIFALIYRAIFRAIGRGGAGFGSLLGLGQWFVAGMLLPLVTRSHGFAWSSWGAATFVGTLILHLSFGATVGLAYLSQLQAQEPLSDSEFDSSEIHPKAS